MKKEWLTPELDELNVQETKDDCYEQVSVSKEIDGEEKIAWKCKHCGAIGIIILGIEHKSWCPHKNDPACPGFGPEGTVTPELGATPIS